MLGQRAIFARRLLAWYDANRRDLPWRATSDPYHVLISEAMLQQTQVATVIPYYQRFLERFPSVHDLAQAQEQDVLRLWQGLGYYSRARNLQRAARAIVQLHQGKVPNTVEALLTLPGVGRYTAGAVASIAHNVRAPIVDGNVIRVISRLDAIETDPRTPATLATIWKRAEELMPKARVGDFNSSMMELGAMVCIPRVPHCLVCPVSAHCQALANSSQNRIPQSRQKTEKPHFERAVFCIRLLSSTGDRWLIEQRPGRGRWAGMWQFVTLESREQLAPLLQSLHLTTTALESLGTVTHALTHRRYTFTAFRCDAKDEGAIDAKVESRIATNAKSRVASDAAKRDALNEVMPLRRWVTASELDAFPLPRPHVKICGLLGLGKPS